MQLDEHGQLVNDLKKEGSEILMEMSTDKADLIHMVMGICGEAGELLDAIKKHTMYNKPLDRENVIEEMGDIAFYMEGIRQTLGITAKECVDYNIKKLRKRYSTGKFSNQQAQLRADKA